jgi:hypothetical protein
MLGGFCLVALAGVAVDSKGVLPQYTMNFRLGPNARPVLRHRYYSLVVGQLPDLHRAARFVHWIAC